MYAPPSPGARSLDDYELYAVLFHFWFYCVTHTHSLYSPPGIDHTTPKMTSLYDHIEIPEGFQSSALSGTRLGDLKVAAFSLDRLFSIALSTSGRGQLRALKRPERDTASSPDNGVAMFFPTPALPIIRLNALERGPGPNSGQCSVARPSQSMAEIVSTSSSLMLLYQLA